MFYTKYQLVIRDYYGDDVILNVRGRGNPNAGSAMQILNDIESQVESVSGGNVAYTLYGRERFESIQPLDANTFNNVVLRLDYTTSGGVDGFIDIPSPRLGNFVLLPNSKVDIAQPPIDSLVSLFETELRDLLSGQQFTIMSGTIITLAED